MKIIVKTIAGSHLFGTNTPQSDQDFKGVFIPSADQIILGNYSDTVSKTTGDSGSKNTKDDIDTELYSLKKFFAMLENGDTAAIELLFTPSQFVIEKTPEWDEIIAVRDKLVSKKINAMIGYARQQANKYGIKGSRMGELNRAVEILKDAAKEHEFSRPKLKHSWEQLAVRFDGFRFVNFITLHPTSESSKPAIDILGKRFDEDTPFEVITKCLSDEYKKYGQRAREAKANNGIDWKALSHAMRCMYQGQELLTTGKVTLPHTGANLTRLKQIKSGEVDYKDLEPEIEAGLETLERLCKESTLPERLERVYLDELLLKFYKAEIK